jgi:hypothetical protein
MWMAAPSRIENRPLRGAASVDQLVPSVVAKWCWVGLQLQGTSVPMPASLTPGSERGEGCCWTATVGWAQIGETEIIADISKVNKAPGGAP